MKQDLREWVDRLRQEQLLERALRYLNKVGAMPGSAFSAAHHAPDFGASILVERLRQLERTAEGREHLGKLRNQVRQWRAAKKRSQEGGVTRKVFLSREADEILQDLVGSAGPGFNISGLIDYLLKNQHEIFRGERSLLDNQRNELRVRAAKQADELKRKKEQLTRRAERLDVREEEIEKWRKLATLARKAARDMAIGPEQEVVVRIETTESGDHTLEGSATLGNRKLQAKVRDSVTEFLIQLVALIEER